MNSAQGWVISGRLLMGDAYRDIRARLKAAGAVFDSKAFVWVCPSAAVHQEFVRELQSLAGPEKTATPVPLPPALKLMPPAPPAPVVRPVVPAAPPAPAPAVQLELPPAPPAPAPAAPALEALAAAITEARLPAAAEPLPSLPPAEPMLDSDGDVRILRLEPSRLAVISIPMDGPRQRKEKGRTKKTEESTRYRGVDALTVTTTVENTIVNPEEYARGKELQGKLGNMLRRFGVNVSDGMIAYPVKQDAAFMKTRAEAKELARSFNASSSHWKLRVRATRLQAVTSEEEDIARDAAYEIQQIMKELRVAMEPMDTARIRSAVEEAKAKAAVLSAGTEQGALYAVVEAARLAANRITREVEKKGRSISEVKRDLEYQNALKPIDSARMMFLEFAGPTEMAGSGSGAAGPGLLIEASRFSELEIDTSTK